MYIFIHDATPTRSSSHLPPRPALFIYFLFKAQHKESGKLAALKRVPIIEDADLEDFMVEIDILAECKHANIVQLYEAFLFDSALWVSTVCACVCVLCLYMSVVVHVLVCVYICVRCVSVCLCVDVVTKLNLLSFGRFLSSSVREVPWTTSFLVS